MKSSMSSKLPGRSGVVRAMFIWMRFRRWVAFRPCSLDGPSTIHAMKKSLPSWKRRCGRSSSFLVWSRVAEPRVGCMTRIVTG